MGITIFKYFMPELLEKEGIGAWQENAGDGADQKRLLASLETVGLKGRLNQEVLGRLVLLEEATEFNEDARQVERGVVNAAALLKGQRVGQDEKFALADQEMTNGRIAALLHDIGESGPAEVAKEQQETVAKLFAVERVNGAECRVSEIVAEHFPSGEGQAMLENLAACGVAAEMTMRQFWDKHAGWTADILKRYPDGLNEHVIAMASAHHPDNGHDFNGASHAEVERLVTEEAMPSLGNAADDLLEKILIAVDRYQAAIRRGKMNHEAAIKWLRKNLARYKGDGVLSEVIEAVDQLGQRGEIFT